MFEGLEHIHGGTLKAIAIKNCISNSQIFSDVIYDTANLVNYTPNFIRRNAANRIYLCSGYRSVVVRYRHIANAQYSTY